MGAQSRVTDCGIMIQKDKKAESLGMKASIMGLSMDDTIDILNKMYNGTVLFHRAQSFFGDRGQKISILNMKPDIFCLELPELDNIDFEDLFDFSEMSLLKTKLVSAKLPKAAKEFRVRNASWVHRVQRVFLWDTTELDFTNFEKHKGSKLEMIVIQSSTGGKPRIIKF